MMRCAKASMQRSISSKRPKIVGYEVAITMNQTGVWIKGRGPFDTSSSSAVSEDESVSDESSCDKWETNHNSSDINDHSYPSAKSEKFRNVGRMLEEIDIVSRDEPQANKENISSNLRTSQENECLPVKKKRGRKPGSKSQRPKPFYVPVRPRYLTVTLKHPEKYPDLVNYKDNDVDPVFVRNTSKDVMWSSTQPFQETSEYRLLKLLRDKQLSNTMANFLQLNRMNRQL